MTQEVINDICARLPYEIFIHYVYRDIRGKEWPTDLNLTYFASEEESVVEFLEDGEVENPKPYLRPMSSMTEEEKKTFTKLKQMSVTVIIPNHATVFRPDYIVDLDDEGDGLNNLYDWLNENHFDYRGLIEKGLALESPEDMYK